MLEQVKISRIYRVAVSCGQSLGAAPSNAPLAVRSDLLRPALYTGPCFLCRRPGLWFRCSASRWLRAHTELLKTSEYGDRS